MECNKEEAIRAQHIAESRMQNKDFIGAKKIVLKAQQLYPDLENIPQMLTVCEVHCSAAAKVNGETDWYGILQVETTADESAIKKQYRKLALLLHPDKNKFAGAEAAFKLIGEAHMILSDRGKRSLHDIKRGVNYRAAQARQPPQQSNRAANAKKEAAVPANVANTTRLHFNGLNQHQNPPSAFSTSQTFWTICPKCSMRYQYYKNILNRPLRCQNCLHTFMAYDMNTQPVPPGMTSGFSHNSSRINWQAFRGPHAPGSTQQSYSGSPCTSFEENVGRSSAASEPLSKSRVKSEVGGDATDKLKTEGKVIKEKETTDEAKFEKVKLDEVDKREKTVKHASASSRKRAKKAVVVSSDSESSDSEYIVVKENDHFVQSNAGTNGTCYPRRSTRQKQNISYNEDGSEDDDTNNDNFARPPSSKRLRNGGSFDKVDQNEKLSEGVAGGINMQTGDNAIPEDRKNGERNATLEGNLRNENVPINKNGMHARGQERMDGKDEGFKAGATSSAVANVEAFSYPDPEFYDFEKGRDPSQFAIDQIWAVYDNSDGMPRFYARIRNVYSPEFKLRFTWLEYDPVGEAEIAWSDEELPVACGNFRHGKTEYTQDRLMFSHLMSCNKGSKRNLYDVYPRKGEVWALFKGWNIGWSSVADNHREYDYEVVEVLSDFAEGPEINVIHLFKIKGFVSLFARAMNEGSPLKISRSDILRFSHKVPSYRLTENEKGIPDGSFELDPAALPTNFGDTFPSVSLDTDAVKVGRLGDDCIRLGSNSANVVKKFTASMAKKSAELNEKDARETQNFSRDLSPDAASVIHTQKHVENTVAPELQTDEKLNIDARNPIQNDAAQNDDGSPLESPNHMCYEYPDTEFFNFGEERSCEKFQKDQIWALYSDIDRHPNYYGLIKKVELEDFKVHLVWLEACPLREEETQWMKKGLPFGCGRFKVLHSMETFDTTETFSHTVEAKPSGRKNRYDIYPNKGDIWALFKNWNVGWTQSDVENCEYDLVEVIEHTGSGLRVALLNKVSGYSSVFMPQRKGGDLFTIEIPMDELLRFSHQIPAFQLTEEKGGKLRGFWELDPAAVPDALLYTD